VDINADSREKYFSIPNSSPIPSQQRRLLEQSCLERGSAAYFSVILALVIAYRYL
jgi:hypothetical protein